MYSSKDGIPKATRKTNPSTNNRSHAQESIIDSNTLPIQKNMPKIDYGKASHAKLKEWAVQKVEEVVDKEAEIISGKNGGFHLKTSELTWDFIHNFSFARFTSTAHEKAPTLLRVLTAAGMDRKQRGVHAERLSTASNAADNVSDSSNGPGEQPSSYSFYSTYFSKPASLGSGKNHRDPFVVSIDAFR